MPTCKVSWCTNKGGNVNRTYKSLFSVPDPNRSLDHKRLCEKWLRYMQHPKFNLQTFKAHPSIVVCEDHFTRDSFTGPYENHVAKSLNFVGKRRVLKKGSVPTMCRSDVARETQKQQHLAERIAEKKLKLKEEMCRMRAANTVSAEHAPELVTRSTENMSVPISSTKTEGSQQLPEEINPRLQPVVVGVLVVMGSTENMSVPISSTMTEGNQQFPEGIMQPLVFGGLVKRETHMVDMIDEMTEVAEDDDTCDMDYSGCTCKFCYNKYVKVSSNILDHTYAAPVEDDDTAEDLDTQAKSYDIR